MNISREHAGATGHFNDFTFALFATLKNWLGNIVFSHQGDEEDDYVVRVHVRQASRSRDADKLRLLDAREERAARRSLRNLLI